MRRYIRDVLMSFMVCIAQVQAATSETSGAIDAQSFAVLSKAEELAESGRYDEAIATLDTIKNSQKLSGYAKSQLWNFYAYIYATREHYAQAIDAYQQLLAVADAPDGLKLNAKYALAQLYFQLEDYTAVIELMEAWLQEISAPTATAHSILAHCYFQNGTYPMALEHLDQAILLAKAEGKPPHENWLRMKAAIYFEQAAPKRALQVYEELLRWYPKTRYLKQIAGLHGELGNVEQRLTTYDAIFLNGGLTSETEQLNLAYLYLERALPYQAGTLIEAGMAQGVIDRSPKNIETLANAWAYAHARDKAIPALKNAAELSDKGVLYARLARVYFDTGDFQAAVQVAKRADTKGSLQNHGANQLLLGMALFNLKKFEQALQAFRQAKTSKKSFTAARAWERYTLDELARLKALKEYESRLAEKTKAMFDNADITP